MPKRSCWDLATSVIVTKCNNNYKTDTKLMNLVLYAGQEDSDFGGNN